jgi:hypothetical protein
MGLNPDLGVRPGAINWSFCSCELAMDESLEVIWLWLPSLAAIGVLEATKAG